MPPQRTGADPKGFYAILGLDPTADPQAITAAFRRKARHFHPDVPGTGDTNAFVAVRQAYDVLGNPARREIYDQAAQEAWSGTIGGDSRQSEMPPANRYRGMAGWLGGQPQRPAEARPTTRLVHRYRFARLPTPLWVALGAILCLCVVETAMSLWPMPPEPSAGIRPNAATVAPLPPDAQHDMRYGPNPVRLVGTPNFYVIPAAGATVLWRHDNERDEYVPVGQLPAFSAVEAVRMSRQNGLVEILYDGTTTRFIDGRRLSPGDAAAARRAYCSYNAGPPPYDGETLQQRGSGNGTLQLANRAIQPAVVKLRDASGSVALAVFLAPGGHADLIDIPSGTFRPDFAIGELWSRACNTFAAGMRAQRMDGDVTTLHEARLVVPPEHDPESAEIPDEAFEQD